MAAGACPPEALLREFLLGLLPEEEIARQTAHLDACSTCLDAARRMAAGDWLVDTLLSSGTPQLAPEPEDEEFTERLRVRGKGLPRSTDDTLDDFPQQAPAIPGYEVF